MDKENSVSRKNLAPIVIELIGIVVIGMGIGVELIMHADIGLAIITGGSCLVAIGGVIWGKFMRRR